MSVSLSPSHQLGFNRPFTQQVKRSIVISNTNGQPVAFKVKTTAPKMYCVRPNSGRIEPNNQVEVVVLLQQMKEDPPPHTKCKDKFLVQSTLITPEKETASLPEIWTSVDGAEDGKVHQQKLKVVYLPPEGDALMEEPEQPSMMSMSMDESKFATVRQSLSAPNGHTPSKVTASPSKLYNDAPTNNDIHHERPPSPSDFIIAREEVTQEVYDMSHPGDRPHTPPRPETREPEQMMTPPSTAPPSAPVNPPEPPSRPIPPPPRAESPSLNLKYQKALDEIARLKAQLDATPTARLRRRNKGGEPDTDHEDSAPADLAVGQTEGVSPQVVIIIALGVFIMTYLFF